MNHWEKQQQRKREQAFKGRASLTKKQRAQRDVRQRLAEVDANTLHFLTHDALAVDATFGLLTRVEGGFAYVPPLPVAEIMELAREEAHRRHVAAFQEQHDCGPEAEWDKVWRDLFAIQYPEARS